MIPVGKDNRKGDWKHDFKMILRGGLTFGLKKAKEGFLERNQWLTEHNSVVTTVSA